MSFSILSFLRIFCRLALALLLLTPSFVVLLGSQPVGAENDHGINSLGVPAQTDYDYKRVALSQEDLPVAIEGNDKFEIFDLSNTIAPDGKFTMGDKTFNGLQRLYKTAMVDYIKVKITDYRDEELLGSFDGARLYMARPGDQQETGSRAFVFRDLESAASFWKAYVDPSHCKYMSESSETYGEQSCASVVLTRPADDAGRLLKLTTVMHVDEPKDFNGKNVRISAWFRVKNVVASVYLEWYEDVPAKMRGTCLRGLCTVSFEDESPNIRDAGQLTAEKWSQRLLAEIPSQKLLIVEVKADKQTSSNPSPTYELGQPVKISGSVRRWNEQKKTYEGVKKAPFVMTFKLPMGSDSPTVITFSCKSGKTIVGEDGTFSFSPFAAFYPGEYAVTIELGEGDYPELQKEKLKTLAETAKFKAEAPSSSPSESQVARIEDLFRSRGVVSHQMEVKVAIEQVRGKHAIWKTLFPSPYPESKLGLANNLLESFGVVSPGFGCIAYQAKTISFLNDLRFYPEKFGVKSWNENPLRGMHYLPLKATWKVGVGIQSLVEEYAGGSLGEHHFVVVYGEVGGWKNVDNTILDPWLTQSPMAYKLGKFSSLLGRMVPIEIVLDPEWLDSKIFWIYWNLNDSVVRRVLSIGYPGGNPELGLQATDEAFALSAMRGVIAKSPVALDILSEDGRRVALLGDGTFVHEVGGSQVFISPNSDTNLEWYVWLPEGRYDVKLRGLGDGEFHLLTGRQTTQQYYGAPIKKDEVAKVRIGTGDAAEPMTLPNGEEVTPVTLVVATTTKATTTKVSTTKTDGGFCVIATAAFGSEMAPEVVYMRFVRDGLIGSTTVGKTLVEAFNVFYYSWSPPIASAIAESSILRGVFRILLLPIVWIVHATALSFLTIVFLTGSPDIASLVAFTQAASLAVSTYIVLPGLVVKKCVRSIRTRLTWVS